MADESAADDGALHELFRNEPIERTVAILATLRRLSAVRGTPTPDQRVEAASLASDPIFPLGFHPIVQRILEG